MCRTRPTMTCQYRPIQQVEALLDGSQARQEGNPEQLPFDDLPPDPLHEQLVRRLNQWRVNPVRSMEHLRLPHAVYVLEIDDLSVACISCSNSFNVCILSLFIVLDSYNSFFVWWNIFLKVQFIAFIISRYIICKLKINFREHFSFHVGLDSL